MQKIEGNFLIKHPTDDYQVHQFELNSGNLNVVQYSDNTVVLQIIETGKPITCWSNKKMLVNHEANEVIIVNE